MRNPANKYSVYTLIDPRDNAVKYVGVTINPKVRLSAHIVDAKNSSPIKRQWIDELASSQLKPEMNVLHTFDTPDEAAQMEKKVYDSHNLGQLVCSDPIIHQYKVKVTPLDKKRTSFALSETAMDQLKKLAESKGLSMASTLETLIREAYKVLP